VCVFLDLIDKSQCAGSEDAVRDRLESLAAQWEDLVNKSTEKSDKLKEASRQQTYNAGVKDMEFWLGEVSFSCSVVFLFRFLLYENFLKVY
jgi:spectrin alpha